MRQEIRERGEMRSNSQQRVDKSNLSVHPLSQLRNFPQLQQNKNTSLIDPLRLRATWWKDNGNRYKLEVIRE